ncbi:RING-H2 finger protein ATL74-like [Dioscorea cayenensis subsp. rotundata]|uniref:RING-H2 finger protein ATL74-like n=1 Tax=Dioscorea cayennensis subsp. rotundata TaxID=55577 RepID=A0AB40AKA0_DIOCR|nr:RING-H2 finger protein ATL74-like [Dioscorea cayenensis subsp. rotundata]
MIPFITGDMLRQDDFPGTEQMRRLLLGKAAETPAASINGNRTHDGAGVGGNDANFDTNMVIILAALLCALICALGLNSIVRCALRCGRRIAFETPEETAARLAGTGLKKRALRQIPVAVYGPEAGILATDCPICLGEFADGEKVRVLPKCNHGFHVRCIDTWLSSHSSCPTCRHSLLDRTAVEGPPETGGDAPVPVTSPEDYVVVDVRSSS